VNTETRKQSTFTVINIWLLNIQNKDEQNLKYRGRSRKTKLIDVIVCLFVCFVYWYVISEFGWIMYTQLSINCLRPFTM